MRFCSNQIRRASVSERVSTNSVETVTTMLQRVPLLTAKGSNLANTEKFVSYFPSKSIEQDILTHPQLNTKRSNSSLTIMFSSMKPITLWGHKTAPSSWKVALILSELDLPYTHKFLELAEVKEPAYEALNPNGRVPTIEDPNTRVVVWEVSLRTQRCRQLC